MGLWGAGGGKDGAVKNCWARRGAGAALLAVGMILAVGCARAAAPAPASTVKAVPLRAAPVVPGRVTVAQVRTADGSKITIATFTGSVSYVLHNGSADPGKLLAAKVTADLAARGVTVTQAQIHARMDQLMEQAIAEVKAGT